MLRSFFVAVGTLLITICACGEVEWKGPLSSRSQRQWESPDKTVVFSISKNPKDSSLEDMFLKRGGEKPIEVKGVESELEQESMGNGWFPDAKYKWIGNRFLVFDSGDGIGVLDIKNERFLINNAFESYIKHPTEDKWMFVRFRGMWRGHGWKPESFTDTIGLIEPTVEALKPEKTSSLSETEGFAHATFFDHVRWITLDGLMVSPPMWSEVDPEIRASG